MTLRIALKKDTLFSALNYSSTTAGAKKITKTAQYSSEIYNIYQITDLSKAVNKFSSNGHLFLSILGIGPALYTSGANLKNAVVKTISFKGKDLITPATAFLEFIWKTNDVVLIYLKSVKYIDKNKIYPISERFLKITVPKIARRAYIVFGMASIYYLGKHLNEIRRPICTIICSKKALDIAKAKKEVILGSFEIISDIAYSTLGVMTFANYFAPQLLFCSLMLVSPIASIAKSSADHLIQVEEPQKTHK